VPVNMDDGRRLVNEKNFTQVFNEGRKRRMKKLFFIVLLFVGGCSTFGPSEKELKAAYTGVR
jgi:hypothetical protein